MMALEKAEFFMGRMLNAERDVHLAVKDGRVVLTEDASSVDDVIDTVRAWPSLKRETAREAPRFNRLMRLGSFFTRVLGSLLL